jgi:hypothetical protein
MKLGALFKWGILIKGVAFGKVAKEVCSETFLQQLWEAESSYKNLSKSPKNIYFTQIIVK